VALALIDGSVDSTVNNPIEAVTGWKEGELRPLCVFDNKPLQQSEKIADGLSWSDLPTCKAQGIDVEYLMLRGVFTTPGATPDQVAYYVDVLKKVRETPEWKTLMTEGAFNQTFLTGAEFAKWLGEADSHHRTLMQEAGLLGGN
jgi:putative tricarboxylic transport membrane protein